MFDILFKFIVFPFVIAFVLGFLYYGLWQVLYSKEQKKETTS